MTKYEWDEWLVPGKTVTLTQGKHFTCSINSIGQQVRNAARAAGVLVSIMTTSDWSISITTRSRPDVKTVSRN